METGAPGGAMNAVMTWRLPGKCTSTASHPGIPEWRIQALSNSQVRICTSALRFRIGSSTQLHALNIEQHAHLTTFSALTGSPSKREKAIRRWPFYGQALAVSSMP